MQYDRRQIDVLLGELREQREELSVRKTDCTGISPTGPAAQVSDQPDHTISVPSDASIGPPEGKPAPGLPPLLVVSGSTEPCPGSGAEQATAAIPANPNTAERIPRPRHSFKPDRSLNPVRQLMAKIVDRLEASKR